MDYQNMEDMEDIESIEDMEDIETDMFTQYEVIEIPQQHTSEEEWSQTEDAMELVRSMTGAYDEFVLSESINCTWYGWNLVNRTEVMDLFDLTWDKAKETEVLSMDAAFMRFEDLELQGIYLRCRWTPQIFEVFANTSSELIGTDDVRVCVLMLMVLLKEVRDFPLDDMTLLMNFGKPKTNEGSPKQSPETTSF
jgi:hypothetical protein